MGQEYIFKTTYDMVPNRKRMRKDRPKTCSMDRVRGMINGTFRKKILDRH